MAEFLEVQNNKKRMCKTVSCNKCKLGASNNNRGVPCTIFGDDYPEEAEKIIMQWAKEHPIKTNADKFKEVFGMDIYQNPHRCAGMECPSADAHCSDCENCGFWLKEYVEPKSEENK